MRSIPKSFYDSETWKKCKREYLKSVHYLCEECKKHGKITPAYHIHHIQHLTMENYLNPEYAYNWDNLEAVCVKHHNELHGNRQRRYEIRPNGEIETI